MQYYSAVEGSRKESLPSSLSHSHAHVAIRRLCNQRTSNALESFFVNWKPHISSSYSSFSVKERHWTGSRCFGSVRSEEHGQTLHVSNRNVVKAQGVLLDYLHSTRGIHFTDAEHISKNCPFFVRRILEKVEDEEEMEKELVRYLRYHPINEFEPFFESIGLNPSEYNPLLPRELMFLSDIEEMLSNYRDLCDYGIARSKIGKMYKEAKDIFMYESGLLKSKLLAYEQLGLRKHTLIKLVASTPTLLLGDLDKDFVLLLKNLEEIGLPGDWIGGTLSEKNTYNWGKMFVLLNLFKDMGFDEKKLGTLISKHPGFLLDGSGEAVFSLICLLLKMGVSRKEIFIMFSEFPHLQVGSFVRNLRRAFQFLVEIEMDFEDVRKLIRNHKDSLGLILLKKPTSIMTNLSSGKKRLCKIIIEDPHQLQKYAMGLKVSPLPSSDDDLKSILEKKKFLSRLGFVENSKKMKLALEVFRGKGDELQDRFDFFVRSGLNPGDVLEMLKRAPHILNQKIEVLDEKLSFIINNLGYPLSSVVRFPQCISFTTERIKLRHLMYDWLKERGKVAPALALGSLIACSDKLFVKRFVSLHPDGPKAWESFKKA
ncbi:transcription termination factor MTEF18, mitochondrial-like [Phalaenopsis equestris]|uniref:transcription termination factor MTEF18, mitochondrial-like n=1 Tax=Phalaenopsis equestris TaxID=78828 RepID=UPI0009E5D81D|nr:transcription termination factor MTEF18, mitochondrial-like [Phalaenopsis equestris]